MAALIIEIHETADEIADCQLCREASIPDLIANGGLVGLRASDVYHLQANLGSLPDVVQRYVDDRALSKECGYNNVTRLVSEDNKFTYSGKLAELDQALREALSLKGEARIAVMRAIEDYGIDHEEHIQAMKRYRFTETAVSNAHAEIHAVQDIGLIFKGNGHPAFHEDYCTARKMLSDIAITNCHCSPYRHRVGDAPLSDYLDALDNTIIITIPLKVLLDPARRELQTPDLTMQDLSQHITARGYKVERRGENDEWVVVKREDVNANV